MKIQGKKRYLLWVVSLVVALAMYGIIIDSKMVPGKYLAVLAGVLTIMYAVLFVLQKKWGRLRFVVAALIEAGLIAVCINGSSIFYHAVYIVDKITDTVTETGFSAADVLADSPLNSMLDAKGCTLGVVDGRSEEAVQQLLDRLSEQWNSTPNIEKYTDMFEAVEALKEGTIDILILNEAYAGLISEIEGYEWFAENTKVLETYIEEVAVEKKEAEEETKQEEIEKDGEKTETPTLPSPSPKQIKPELMEAPEQVDWNTLVNQEMLEAPEGAFVAYISGVDTWGSVGTKSRSDVNILAVVNTNTKKVLLVSTPRDYYVPLSISNGVKDKLTHAGIYGINTSVETLELLYGVDIQYYVRVNFTGFVGIIDALGGVDVYSDSDFTVGDVFSYTEGVNHMSGIEALAFARERYTFASGDRARGTHQMEVIKAVLQKCASPSILYNYADVMNSMSGCFSTNMPHEKIAALVRMQLGDMAQWEVTSLSVDGTGASKTTYTVPEKKAYVMVPDEATVQLAKDSIAAILQ